MLKVQAAHSSQAALLNWVSTSYPSSTVNSPTFTTDRGYAGDGVSSYVASGYVPKALTQTGYLRITLLGAF